MWNELGNIQGIVSKQFLTVFEAQISVWLAEILKLAVYNAEISSGTVSMSELEMRVDANYLVSDCFSFEPV
jgi:hypothetical protein